MFKLVSDFSPIEEQKQAVEKLCFGIENNLKNQVLLGVTGSGKTFTMANVIKKTNLPTLIISHNKTLAGQLYQEMRQFFPKNAVSYFVSYYDYYQPEAYIPQTDTYIEKEAEINELIDKLRLATTTNILTRDDVIVVASVSCIYNIGSPLEYGRFILELEVNKSYNLTEITSRLADLQYEKGEFEFKRGTFRIRGENIDIYPAYEDYGYRIFFPNNILKKIKKFEPLTGKEILRLPRCYVGVAQDDNLRKIVIYPAKHYLTDPKTFNQAEAEIRKDLKMEYQTLKKQNKLLKAERLLKRVNYDLEMIKELGYVNGIENYSRYFDGRKIGQPPYTLINYFNQRFSNNWLIFIDESHMTVPQLRGMYNGDFARKKTLVDFGFRLKAAFDNRPLTFPEFYQQVPQIIYVSATPDEWEVKRASSEARRFKVQGSRFKVNSTGIVEQLVRPTGIVDPKIIIRKAENEVGDLLKEIEKRVKQQQRVLVTTLTKRIAEDLTAFLKEKNIKAQYLHADIKTLERSRILTKLRKKDFDVLIGINLLREGLDLPEVVLVAILDADKEGFLRSKTALIQTMGRAARNIKGEVIIYADTITKSIRETVGEIERRRKYQLEYNKKHGIVPRNIYKPVREEIMEEAETGHAPSLQNINVDSLTPYDRNKLINKLKREMRKQAENLNFELAIAIREKIRDISHP
jgi:excinuclease ABC subunit B